MAYTWDNRVAFVVRYLYETNLHIGIEFLIGKHVQIILITVKPKRTLTQNQIIVWLSDIDNNGYLDAHDFQCLALRTCVLEGKGDCSSSRLQKYQHIMLSLWEEIAQLADFDKDGIVTADEFKQAVQNSCIGKRYEDFPQAMKAFIETNFRMIDINSDGILGIEEYRYDCVQRMAVDDIKAIDEAYNSLLNDDDRRKGGIALSRYQELFALFLSDQGDDCPAKYLFGPLEL